MGAAVAPLWGETGMPSTPRRFRIAPDLVLPWRLLRQLRGIDADRPSIPAERGARELELLLGRIVLELVEAELAEAGAAAETLVQVSPPERLRLSARFIVREPHELPPLFIETWWSEADEE
jgi:hypothetical protein